MEHHLGHHWNFQILSAIVFFLENDYDKIAFELNFEDSSFFIGNVKVAIGEAKHLSEDEHWTEESLFYKGNEKGPLIQLLERCRNDERLLLFSSRDLKPDIKKDISIDIPKEKVEEIYKKIKKRFSKKISNVSTMKIGNLIDFISNIEFRLLNLEELEEKIIGILHLIGLTSSKERIRDFLGYISSKAYNKGEPLERHFVIVSLLEETKVGHYADILKHWENQNIKKNMEGSIDKIISTAENEGTFERFDDFNIIVIDYFEKTVNSGGIKELNSFSKIINAVMISLSVSLENVNTKKKVRILTNIDQIFREQIFKIMKKSFNNDWDMVRLLFSWIREYLEILTRFKDEGIFSNWLQTFHEFYQEILRKQLNELDTWSYDSNLKYFIIDFSILISKPILESLKVNLEFFSFEYGVEIIKRIVLERINNAREFYYDDESSESPRQVSIMIEPLVGGFWECFSILNNYPSADLFEQQNSLVWNDICELGFCIYEKYRDLNKETRINRFGLNVILAHPLILNSEIYTLKFENLVDYPKATRFDYLITRIEDILKVDSGLVLEGRMVSLFKSSLKLFKIQRKIYYRVSFTLYKLCVICTKNLTEKVRLELELELIDELIKPPQRNDDNFAFYGYQLLGNLLIKVGEEEFLVKFFKEKSNRILSEIAPTFRTLNRYKTGSMPLLVFILKENEEIINWQPEEKKKAKKFSGYQITFEEWEIESAKVINKLFRKFGYSK